MVILPFIIGCGVGAGVFYFIKKDDLDRLGELETELNQLRRELQHSEANHEQRLREVIAQLQQEYQGKITALEAQLAAQKPSPTETVETSETPEVKEVTNFVITTLEPPILAAEIHFRPGRTPLSLSTPSGQPCDPPILAQGMETAATPEKAIISFEPPILVAEIHFRAEVTPITLATPSGKPCTPPILAQS